MLVTWSAPNWQVLLHCHVGKAGGGPEILKLEIRIQSRKFRDPPPPLSRNEGGRAGRVPIF